MMARKRKAGLTEPQIKVLEVLDRFQRKSGYPPSIREIKDKAQLSSTSVVNYYLDQLEEMGYIERDQHVSRVSAWSNPWQRSSPPPPAKSKRRSAILCLFR